MSWGNLVLGILGLLVGGSVTAVLVSHKLAVRRRVQGDADRLFAKPLEGISKIAEAVLREARPEWPPRLDLHSHVAEAFDSRLEEIEGLERLSLLPEGFRRLPVLCRQILERYADCRLSTWDRRRRGEDASAEAQREQEVAEIAESLQATVMEATSRIRATTAWNYRKLEAMLRKDEGLAVLGQRILDLEEALEALFEPALEGMAGGEGDSRLASLLEAHERLRRAGINLVASENRPSPAVLRALGSDLAGRYQAEGYGGSLYARRIVEEAERLARETFKAGHALVSPVSGNLCVLAVLFAFTSPGDAVGLIPFTAGGYPFGVEKFHRRRVAIPADPETLEIDVGAAVEALIREGAKVAFLGASFIPFPHPVRDIRRRLEEEGYQCLLVYDGSHVLGLIACDEFQDPLREGADILIGSTHKSLFGPQGGLILTDRAELAGRLRQFLELDLQEGIGLVDNPHLNRIAALGLALEEIGQDPGYGRRVIENARALAGALHAAGVPVRFAGRGYTASHQVLLGLGEEEAMRLCRALEAHGIFVDAWGRLGTAEITRQGMGREEMERIAGWIAAVYRGEEPPALDSEVGRLAERFSGQYT